MWIEITFIPDDMKWLERLCTALNAEACKWK
nr:MAG TPA: Protein of unknown function (DUF3579) [Caudoviricetes sp.]